MKSIPEDLALTRTTAVFDSTTTPEKMLNEHKTGSGTWGRINVIAGVVTYRILGNTTEEYTLTPQLPGVIEPDTPHQIKPTLGAQFFLEFYRDNTTG
jgi:tellurite resistance-related uncharacterized protein